MNVRYEHTPSQPALWHEYANLFPLLAGEALDALREDIRQHGVREPIVFLDGAILDGRNRYMCARDLGLNYPRTEYDGDDPLGFVVSHNLHRRHLSESQRASVAAKIANMPVGANQHAGASANLRTLSERAAPQPPQTSVADAAKLLNVSERSVTSARKVHDAAPELVPHVDAGGLSVSLAAKVAELPPEDVAAVATASAEEVKEVARAAVKRAHVANNGGNNEWYTPAEIIEAARQVLGGFDLDPASSEIANATVKAGRIFTADDDGIAQDWPIGRLWMNPPYAQPLIGKFAERFAAEIQRGSSGIVLVNNATETAWFQTLAAACTAICFPQGRIRFLDPDGNPGAPLQGQAILYFGADTPSFRAAFSGMGFVVEARA